MITLSESLLTSAQWNALQTLVSGAEFDVTLYAWNPVFDTSLSGSISRNDFDSAVYSGIVLQYSSGGVLDRSGNPLGSYTDPANVNFDIPPSLLTDTNLYAAAVTSSGISQASYNGSWSSWTQVVTSSTVVFMAQTSATTIHYVTFDGTNYQFHLWNNGSIIDSDIYWGFPITSFSARRLAGRDVLAFTGNTPGTPSAKTENLKVVKYILPTGIVGVITYQYGTWSDHIEVDRVDQWSLFRYRSNLKLSVIGDTLWLSCYSSEGTAKAPVTGTRLYSSKDGIHWSRGELLSLARSGEWGTSIQRLGNTVYALGRKGGSSADATLLFGNPASSTVLSLSRYVHQLTVNRRDMQQMTMVVDNHRGALDSSLLSQERTMALVLNTGFWTVSGLTLQQQGIFEVDSIEPLSDQPDSMFQISARDHMAWMTTKTQSEQFINWLPQGLGLDAYIDTTGTGYGGMTHTAPADGTWQAHDNLLYLTTSNQSGLVYSTYLFDTWNGSVQSNFALAQAANNEYAGLIFRSQDKDNGYAYYYDQASAKLRLERWSAGIHTVLWQSSTKSWGSTPSRYLRADFRYSQIRLFSSSASGAVGAHITWTLEHEMVVDGFTNSAVADSGYVGMLAKGFSDLDTWNSEPDPIGAGELPPWIDPYVPGTGVIIPPVTGDLPLGGMALAAYEASASYATNYDQVGHVISWSPRNNGKTGSGGPGYSNPYDYGTFYAFSSVGLEKCVHQSSASSHLWTNPKSLTALYGAVGATATVYAHGSHLVSGWGIAISNAGYISVTWNNWATCTAYLAPYLSIAIAPHNANVVYGVYRVTGTLYIDKSTDGGITWTPVSNMASANLGTYLTLEIPYTKPSAFGGGNNVDNGSLVIRLGANWQFGGSSGAELLQSHDSGASFPTLLNSADYWSLEHGYAISTHTWDGDRIAFATFTGTQSDGSMATSNNNAGALYSNHAVLGGNNQHRTNIGVNGWPMVGTSNPAIGIWVAFGFSDGVLGQGVSITFDNGTTWWGAQDPTWGTLGCSYFELSLVEYI